MFKDESLSLSERGFHGGFTFESRRCACVILLLVEAIDDPATNGGR